MVPPLTLLMICLTLAMSLLLPAAFLLVLCKGRKGVFGVWLAGALGFFIPQMVIRIPILQWLGTQAAFKTFAGSNPYVYALALALSAAVFETAGRYLVLKFALRGRLSYMTGLAAGAGHGGIEAIALIGLTYINNLVISLMINAGQLSTLIPDPDMAAQISQALTGTEPLIFLMAGFERIFTMVFHVALSLLLAWFLTRGKAIAGVLLVLGLHAAVDFIVVVLQIRGLSIWLIEGAVMLCALASLLLIVKLRPLFGASQTIPADPAEQAVQEGY
jgi:uncharacterized membrane protein YhfC